MPTRSNHRQDVPFNCDDAVRKKNWFFGGLARVACPAYGKAIRIFALSHVTLCFRFIPPASPSDSQVSALSTTNPATLLVSQNGGKPDQSRSAARYYSWPLQSSFAQRLTLAACSPQRAAALEKTGRSDRLGESWGSFAAAAPLRFFTRPDRRRSSCEHPISTSLEHPPSEPSIVPGTTRTTTVGVTRRSPLSGQGQAAPPLVGHVG